MPVARTHYKVLCISRYIKNSNLIYEENIDCIYYDLGITYLPTYLMLLVLVP